MCPYGNPHYWTDPNNGRVIARAIARPGVGELDPAGKAAYDKNLAAFEARLVRNRRSGTRKWPPTPERRS